MNKIPSLIAIFLLLTIIVKAQDDDFLKKQLEFLEQIKGSYEGFHTSNCKNIISYHSLRNDITDGLITRASNGSMDIEWQTQAIPDSFKADGAWFVWLAAIDISDKKVNFDVFIDEEKHFTFPSGKKKSWTLTHPDGRILKYRSFDSDQHGDSHGYMTMYAPKSWLKPGKPLNIKIVGEAAGENTWVIIYKAGDIISYLEKSIEFQIWLDVSITEAQSKNNVVVTAPELFESFVEVSNPLPSISGERPALWLYIHGPGHQKALNASREGDILLPMAEKFATIDAMTDQSFNKYPAARLQKAWEAKIYPDHGWGGKNGQITDDLFRRKFEFARSEAKQILENASFSISSKINTNQKKGIPVVIFNSLGWERTDIVNFQVNFSESEAMSITVQDNHGNNIPLQYQVNNQYLDGSIQSAKVHLIAKNIPSIGYQTYYIQKSENTPKSYKSSSLENGFYKIVFADGGLRSIYDKSLQKELVDDSKFVAGEVFTMQSVGNGAGEFDKIQQPSMEGFDQTGNHAGDWKTKESGDIFCSWVKRSELPHAVVEQKIILYHTIKRIDFKVALLNWEGELFREFRLALPLNMEDGQVAYEVPFGVVEVGKDEMEGAAGERYNVPAKDLHPRGIENWIEASDKYFGVTLSSSVAVADYIDPTDNPVSYPILQPILLASRVSCHGEGNKYLQTGNHYFSFSLDSHLSGWENGFRFGRQANEKLFAVVNPKPYKSASLSESQSFFGVESENLVISTVKKAEDDNSIIVRVYETEGKDTKSVLKTSNAFKTAMQTNLIEKSIRSIEVNKSGAILDIGHHAIETIKLK